MEDSLLNSYPVDPPVSHIHFPRSVLLFAFPVVILVIVLLSFFFFSNKNGQVSQSSRPDRITPIISESKTTGTSNALISPPIVSPSVAGSDILMQYSNHAAGYTIRYPKRYDAFWKVYQAGSPFECRVLQLHHAYFILSVDKNRDRDCQMRDFEQIKERGNLESSRQFLTIEHRQMELDEVFIENILADTSGKKNYTLIRQPHLNAPIISDFADANNKAYTYIEIGGNYSTDTQIEFQKEYDELIKVAESMTFQAAICASSVLNLQVTNLPPGMTCEAMDAPDKEFKQFEFGSLNIKGRLLDLTINTSSGDLFSLVESFCALSGGNDRCRLQAYTAPQSFSLQAGYIDDVFSVLVGVLELSDGNKASVYLYKGGANGLAITQEDEQVIKTILEHTIPINLSH